MASGDRDDPAAPDELLRVNRVLDEQLKTLVKTEQRLFVTQRILARQNARLDALNRFAVDAVELTEPAEVLARAASVLFSLFPFDRAVGFLAGKDGLFVPVAVRAAEGRGQVREGAALRTAVRCEPPPAPVIGPFEELRARAGLEPLLAATDGLFVGDATTTPGALAVVIPLAKQGGDAVGVLALRRLTTRISFHEELPTPSDAGFLGTIARLVTASVTNAHLVKDLKDSYEQLAQAQRTQVDRERLAALGEFAAIVAHEVRNPLSVIFNARALLHRLVHGDEAARLLDIVGEESERLDRLVGDLIDFARPHPPRFRSERLTGIIEGVVEGVRASNPTASVTVVAEPDLPEVWADASMVRRGILNLVVNAVQASGPASPVVVRVTADAGRRVRIAVEDRGAGVPAAIADRILEPFFTTKATGTGLGLAVVKRVAEAHGGQLEISAREGGGSVFVITVAVTPATPLA